MQTQTPKYQGEPSIEALATGLGTLGRYGDEYMVHAAHGETVVPAEILEANPELKNQLFQQMRMMGIKDPNRYVVGNALNSINPLTGQPEFFFKRVFRAIRKVIKKVAPVVVPIIGNMIAPGIGGPVASALMTKMQGGSWGDALKGAALSYGASALGSGVKGIMSASAAGQPLTSGFFSGLKQGALAPFEAASNLFSTGSANPLAQGIFGPRGAGLIFNSAAGDVGRSFSPAGANFGERAMNTIFPSYQSPSTFNQALNAPQGQINDPITGQPTAGRAALDTAVDTGTGIETVAGGDVAGNTGKQTFLRFGERMGEGESGNMFTRLLDRNPGIARVGEKILTSTAGPLAVTGLTYYLASGDEEPDLSPEDIEKMTDPQRASYNKYNQMRSDPNFATWRTSDEARNLLGEAGIYSSYGTEDIANITGTTLDQARQAQDSIYGGPMFGPGFQDGGIAGLKTGMSLEQKNEEVLSTGNLGDTFIHEGVTYKAGRPPEMVSQSETMMTSNMQPQTASGIFGGSGVATPDPNYTPSPNDFKSPLLQRLAQEAFKTPNIPPQTTVPYQQLNMARPLQSPPNIQASGIFMQNPNQGLISRNAMGMPQIGGPVNQQQPMILAAGGGEIKGPGTGTSDSIPANLSDGEFVMTAEAVRNAGGGNRNLGAARMYDLMSRFEGGRA